jgi:hypothetical protein
MKIKKEKYLEQNLTISDFVGIISGYGSFEQINTDSSDAHYSLYSPQLDHQQWGEYELNFAELMALLSNDSQNLTGKFPTVAVCAESNYEKASPNCSHHHYKTS